ncbi:MAG: HAD-IA family hydrolase [Acaryochloris sp. RU_4_1]|nr:HAD-IA family hydrolase [Acaryochloris sp. RU_4_1]NJR54532.1 HAD-IA family hydrolase [Acaryochloris sp. CRU_2_0]
MRQNSGDRFDQTLADGQLQALIFDMDGVLCNTMPYHLQAWLDYSATIPALAGASRKQLEKMGGKRNQELLPELLGHPVAAADLQRWSSEKEAVYRSLIRDDIQWLPGLIPFLQQAQSVGLRLGLGTSACWENVDLLLSQDQLRDFFSAQVIETDVERGKPDPQCYLLVAERLGVVPEQCLVFEDAIAGVQAARDAAMRCWGVLTTHTADELQQAGAEYCIQDFTDPALEQLINS